VELERAVELHRGRVRIAVEQRDLRQRMREGRKRVGVPRVPGDSREGVRARPGVWRRTAHREPARGVAQPPDGVVTVLGGRPALE